MRRPTLQLLRFASTLLLCSGLLGCQSGLGAQAPVSASAQASAFHHNSDAPGFFQEAGSDQREQPEVEAADARVSAKQASIQGLPGQGLPGAVNLLNASAPRTALTPTALAKAAGIYVHAQSLEETHAYPQAVAAYDRLLKLEADYADAQSRRDTLLELVRLADDLYVKAMDADSADERLHLLRQVNQFWPEYRDVSQQLKQPKR